MEKMYALNFTNNGNGMDSRPYGTTIAISSDIELLKAKMRDCIEEDCLETEDDFAHNFQIYRQSSDGMSVDLESKLDFELTLTYEIQEVEVLQK